jgi:hypothetical protein
MLRHQFRDQSAHDADVNISCPQQSAHHEADFVGTLCSWSAISWLGISFIGNSLSQTPFSTGEVESLAVDTDRLHYAPTDHPHPFHMMNVICQDQRRAAVGIKLHNLPSGVVIGRADMTDWSAFLFPERWF